MVGDEFDVDLVDERLDIARREISHRHRRTSRERVSKCVTKPAAIIGFDLGCDNNSITLDADRAVWCPRSVVRANAELAYPQISGLVAKLDSFCLLYTSPSPRDS